MPNVVLENPVRPSFLARYAYAPLLAAFTILRPLGTPTLVAPLVPLGLYNLLSLNHGWSERAVTFALFTYVILAQPPEDALNLASLICFLAALFLVEMERVITEYTLSGNALEVRRLEQGSLLPRISSQKIPLYLITGVKIREPATARLLEGRYVELVVETPTGSVVLGGVDSRSRLLRALRPLASRESEVDVKEGRVSLSVKGKGFEINGLFDADTARAEFAEFHRLLKVFAGASGAKLTVRRLGAPPRRVTHPAEAPAEVELEKGEKPVRNRIERLL